MPKKRQKSSVGSWAFLIGVVLALILGVMGNISQGWLVALVIIGLIVGLLNITENEAEPFMIAGIVLIIASAFGQGVVNTIPSLSRILEALLVIFVPATIIVAIKHVFSMARN